MTQHYLYVPGNFDEEQLFRDFPPENYPFRKTFSREKLLWILSQLVEVPFFNHKVVDHRGYVHLHSTLLQKVVHDYADYLDYLKQANIITSDNQYIARKKAKGYQLTDDYSSCFTIREIPIPTTSKFYKTIEKSRPSRIELEARKKYSNLTQWFNDRLSIDQELADEIIKELYFLRATEKDLDWNAFISSLFLPGLSTRKEDESFSARARNYMLPIHKYALALYHIRNKRWFAKVDDTAGRFHSPLTNLKSELRYCLRYAGKEMVSVDIKNSQPYLALLLLNPAFYEKKDDLPALLRAKQVEKGIPEEELRKAIATLHQPPITLSSFPKIYKDLSQHDDYASFIMLVLEGILSLLPSVMTDKTSVDLLVFQQEAQGGKLYEYLGAEMLKRNLPRPADRGELKAVVFLVLFTSNKFFVQQDALPKRIFEEIFPTVYKVFSFIKTGRHARLPILLQKIESRLFLDLIAQRISREQPQLPIYTIHDSVVTLKSYEDYVSRVIQEECARVVGVPPTVSIDEYTSVGARKQVEELCRKAHEASREKHEKWVPLWPNTVESTTASDDQ